MQITVPDTAVGNEVSTHLTGPTDVSLAHGSDPAPANGPVSCSYCSTSAGAYSIMTSGNGRTVRVS